MPHTAFTLSLIVAIADNGVIGRDAGLPWRLGSDMKRFRKLTMGHPLIMGRRTFETLPKALDGRDSIVVTRGAVSREGEGLYFAPSLEQAVALAGERAAARGTAEAFVIGGAQLYAQALPLAGRVYLTLVHGAPLGDTYWRPEFGPEWQDTARDAVPAGPKDEFAVTHVVMERTAR